jgi:hypothetical protein
MAVHTHWLTHCTKHRERHSHITIPTHMYNTKTQKDRQTHRRAHTFLHDPVSNVAPLSALSATFNSIKRKKLQTLTKKQKDQG